MRYPSGAPPRPLKGRLVSVSQPSPGLQPARLLQLARGQARFYWQDGQHPVTFVGFGAAAEIVAWGARRIRAVERQARALFHEAIISDAEQPLASPRLMGGFAFDDDFTPDVAWSRFHPAHFVLPHYQLVAIGDRSWLSLNAVLPPDERPDDVVPQLQAALDARYRQLLATPVTAPAGTGQVTQITYPLTPEGWEQRIAAALREIRAGSLQKVVLSRVCELTFADAVAVDEALAYLQAHYSGCYRFLFEPRPGHAFLGASPELLAQVEDQHLTTMALAGSIGRGATSTEDRALTATLLESAKDRHEHEVVLSALLRRLGPVTDTLTRPETGVLRLNNIQHLYTPLTGRLRQPNGILPLVARLHPTPALGGAPRPAALEFIRGAEPVPRGWYAAPVGWIDHRLNGLFAVAIRSAVAQINRVWLYAGAGIVAESVADREWAETELKFRPMLQALKVIEGEPGRNHATAQEGPNAD